jgi:hypothetical protein
MQFLAPYGFYGKEPNDTNTGYWSRMVSQGIQGLKGDLGSLPTGGSAGEVLAKLSATNYDVGWVTAGSGGGGGGGAGITSLVLRLDYNSAGQLQTVTKVSGLGSAVINGTPTNSVARIDITLTGFTLPPIGITGYGYNPTDGYKPISVGTTFLTRSMVASSAGTPDAFSAFDPAVHKLTLDASPGIYGTASGANRHAYVILYGI